MRRSVLLVFALACGGANPGEETTPSSPSTQHAEERASDEPVPVVQPEAQSFAEAMRFFCIEAWDRSERAADRDRAHADLVEREVSDARVLALSRQRYALASMGPPDTEAEALALQQAADAYERELEAARRDADGACDPEPEVLPREDELLARAEQDERVAAGRALFEANCAPCHGPQADGVIGPSLRDEAWIHGREPARIFGTIADGVPPRGMPAWRPLLGAEAVADLTAYVIALGRD